MWLVVALAVFAGPHAPSADELRGQVRIYLMRHAEKAREPGSDPALTEAGLRRAAALAEKLGATPIDAIYATRFRRTQQTVEPLAKLLGLQPVIVKDQPAALARWFKRNARGKTVVFAGHSNTLPPLLRALGARARIRIREGDYGDLFLVVIDARGRVRMSRSRYGP